ncbi:unnamed protein product [Ceratitis capitata]|uniref:(Mediterranean fruit fly) hypothetical protein n=1 Tax=Ceratitis capitata TaxID=7213 RepID=A0A811UMS0_CERCA|nr:unnamed protein product [Ceratitis capitata]
MNRRSFRALFSKKNSSRTLSWLETSAQPKPYRLMYTISSELLRCLPKPVRECCRLQTLTLTLTSTLLSKHKESVAVSGFEQLCHVTRAASGEDLPGNWPRQRGDGTWEQLRASGYEGSVALVAANHCHALLQIYQFHS